MVDEAQFTLSTPENEPVLNYAPGSAERAALKAQLVKMAGEEIEIPLIIGGKEIYTGNLATCVMPHDHGHVLAKFHQAGPKEIAMAIDAANHAWEGWPKLPWAERVSVFLRAAELLAGPYRQVVNGATMLGQSKTAFQAEIDSACELIDFWRFNPHFMEEVYGDQPMSTLVSICCCHQGQVHTLLKLHLCGVDFRENTLFCQTHRVISSAVKTIGIKASKISYSRDCKVNESIHKFIHSPAMDGNFQAGFVAFTNFEIRDAFFGFTHNRHLVCNHHQVLFGQFQKFLVLYRFAYAHRNNNLFHSRHRHWILIVKFLD